MIWALIRLSLQVLARAGCRKAGLRGLPLVASSARTGRPLGLWAFRIDPERKPPQCQWATKSTFLQLILEINIKCKSILAL